jgi:hypothetical protein
MANNIYLPPSPVVPGALIITAITNTNPMVVSFTNSIYNTYTLGQLVCLTVPQQYGMTQANELTGEIINISGTNFTLNINASNFDPFSIPPPSFPPPTRPASLSPAGSRNIYNITVEPFRSLNGEIGN